MQRGRGGACHLFSRTRVAVLPIAVGVGAVSLVHRRRDHAGDSSKPDDRVPDRRAVTPASKPGAVRTGDRSGRCGVWDWNLDTDEIYVDPLLKATLGDKDHEIANRFDDWSRLVHADDAPAVMRACRSTSMARVRTTRWSTG
jgi:hypothetical protein